MTQRTMVRSMLAAVVAVTLLTAPAAAAAPDRAAEAARSGWVIDLGGLLERAWGLLVGERDGERRTGEDKARREGRGRVQRIAGADGSSQGSGMDPNG